MLDSEKIYDLINGQTDVFLSQNGWSLMCNPYGWENGFLVRIANNSSATFTIVPSWPDGTGIITPANTTLGPYSTLDYFAGISILDKNAKFTIQLNGSDPEDPSINLEFSFAAHLNYGSIFSGGNAVIDLITSSSNSYITFTNTLGASESESNGGSALLILSPNPENDTKLD